MFGSGNWCRHGYIILSCFGGLEGVLWVLLSIWELFLLTIIVQDHGMKWEEPNLSFWLLPPIFTPSDWICLIKHVWNGGSLPKDPCFIFLQKILRLVFVSKQSNRVKIVWLSLSPKFLLKSEYLILNKCKTRKKKFSRSVRSNCWQLFAIYKMAAYQNPAPTPPKCLHPIFILIILLTVYTLNLMTIFSQQQIWSVICIRDWKSAKHAHNRASR